MKKIVLLTFLMIWLLPLNVYAVTFSNDSMINSSSGSQGGCKKDSCWSAFHTGKGYQAIRITVYHESGKKVSNSVDFTNDSRYLFNDKNFYSTTNKKSKIDYIKEGDNGNFTFSIKTGANIHYLNFPSFIDVKKDANKNLEWLLSKYLNTPTQLTDVTADFSYCSGAYKCTDTDISHYYIVVEPATIIRLNNEYYFGTYYELKWLYNTAPFNISPNESNRYYWAATVVRNYLPESLTLSNRSYINFYNNTKLDYGDFSISHYTSDNNDAFGIGVLNANGIVPPPKQSVIDQTVLKEYKCPIDVSINGCGDSSISEPSSKECLVNNGLYLYNQDCNIYCSEKITTSFGGFYETFQKVDVKDNAIASGRYIPIKDSPKIVIEKTCYKGAGTGECSDWKSSLEKQIKGEYNNKRSELILNVDENRYTLFDDSPSVEVKSNGADNVIYKIQYEHKMDPNINKYISIETGKDVGNNLDKYKDAVIEFDNIYGRIMIKRNVSGTYKYNLDLSSSKLNKYVNGSNNLTKIIMTSYSNKTTNTVAGIIYNTTYNYKFNNTINRNYASTDLNFGCDFVKANPCICPINTVCDPVTCEPVGNPQCECNSECGCYDNKTCDPIPCERNKKCDPEKELCYVYRPISLANPFPGIEGDNRTPGDNWNGVARYSNGDLIYYHGSITSLSDYYIKYNRGYTDYELYREAEPLYVIKLDGDKIRAIRQYNDYKKHDYNDSELDCDENGQNCISKFLRGRANHFNIDLLESGTCKNIRPSTFDSCITRKN